MAALSSSFLLPKVSNGRHTQPSSSFSSSSFSSAKLPRPFKTSAAYTTEQQPRTMATSSSLYEVLGIPSTATCHEIKAAYRRLARTCHPDVKKKETSASEFMKIHEAYSTLYDPDKRATYDRDLYGKSSRVFSSSAASMSRFSGFTRKKWETDQCW